MPLPSQTILVVADRWRIDDAHTLVRRLPSIRVIEQTGAITQEHRNDVDFHLVDQAGLHVLLGNVRAAPKRNVFAPRGVPSPIERSVNAFGDEVERRAPCISSGLRP